MNQAKQKYLNQIRLNTAYPAYRGIIGVIAVLGYILAVVYGLGSIIGGLGAMSQSFLGGIAFMAIGLTSAAVIYVAARFWRDAALILADIGDSIIETHASASSTKDLPS